MQKYLVLFSNAIRALAIIFPVLIPASYLLKHIPLVLIAQLLTWLLYTAALTYWPIKRRGLYTFITMVIVTFCYAVTGAILHADFTNPHHFLANVSAVIIGAIVLTIGTLLFTLIAWVILMLLDQPFRRVADRFKK